MNRVGYALMFLGAAWLFYVYAGYPICLWVMAFFHPIEHTTDEGYLPFVSVLIAARNEERDIEWKIRQTLCWDYPRDRLQLLVASDASDDQTDEIIKRISDPRLQYVRISERVGKVRALNRLVRLAKGELLFFTDANSDIEAGALRRVVRHFADPQVGCVTGADRTSVADQGDKRQGHAIAVGETAYWNYELLIDDLESRLGSVLVCFGAIHCIRRHLYEDCDPDLANDLEVPIRIGNAGHLVLFEPAAVSFEPATSSSLEEFRRRRRICGQGALGLYRLRQCLHRTRAWQFLSRKFLRWLAVLPLLAILIGSILADHTFLGSSLLVLQLVCYGTATVGIVATSCGWKVATLVAVPFYFVLVNVAAFVGVMDACRGKRYSFWNIASKTRGQEAAGS